MSGQIIPSSLFTNFYLRKPLVIRSLDTDTISWRIETPNKLIEATPCQEKFGHIINRYLKIVNPQEYQDFLVEQFLWIKCPDYFQQTKKLIAERVQSGEELSDEDYINLIVLARPDLPQPSSLSKILHVQQKILNRRR